jgi:hypothetical protein
MAHHTQLPIYKVAYDLLDVVADIHANMNRSFKRSIGEKIIAECVDLTVLVFRANVSHDKGPHLIELIERLEVVELMLRLGKDKGIITNPAWSRAVKQTTSIGKQANGWRKSASRPLHGGQGCHG